jgi:TIR domain-containing protein
MQKIFISHRRSDTEMAAGRLRDSLVRHFGEERVFRDRESIDGGVDWLRAVHRALKVDTVILALIGRSWLAERDSQARRLIDNVNNANRLELEQALLQRLPIIPVLVGGVLMPSSDELPESLRALARITALPLRDSDWATDLGHITEALERVGVAPAKTGLSAPRRFASARALFNAVVAAVILSTAILVAIEIMFGWEFDPAQTSLLVLIVFGITIFAIKRRASSEEKNGDART